MKTVNRIWSLVCQILALVFLIVNHNYSVVCFFLLLAVIAQNDAMMFEMERNT